MNICVLLGDGYWQMSEQNLLVGFLLSLTILHQYIVSECGRQSQFKNSRRVTKLLLFNICLAFRPTKYELLQKDYRLIWQLLIHFRPSLTQIAMFLVVGIFLNIDTGRERLIRTRLIRSST